MSRVVEVSRFSASAKMATYVFVMICIMYHVIVNFLPKKRCFDPKEHFPCPKSPKKCINRDKIA